MSQEAGATGASWSPSGDLLAYVAGAGQNGQLIVKDAAKGALSREISVSPYYLLGMRRNRIAWESESRLKLIAYPRASGGEAMRISVPVDGSEPARQVSSRGSDLTVDGPWRVSVRPTGSEFNEWRVELGLPRDQSSADSHELQKNMILGTGGPPFWHPSRSELYFRTADSLYVVRVPAQGSTGISRNAFPLGRPFPPPSMSAPDFDVFPDGRRFVMIKHGDPVVEIQVALNWF
jgi:hypothetical protein